MRICRRGSQKSSNKTSRNKSIASIQILKACLILTLPQSMEMAISTSRTCKFQMVLRLKGLLKLNPLQLRRASS